MILRHIDKLRPRSTSLPIILYTVTNQQNIIKITQQIPIPRSVIYRVDPLTIIRTLVYGGRSVIVYRMNRLTADYCNIGLLWLYYSDNPVILILGWCKD